MSTQRCSDAHGTYTHNFATGTHQVRYRLHDGSRVFVRKASSVNRSTDNVTFKVVPLHPLHLNGVERSVLRVDTDTSYSVFMNRDQRFSSLFKHYAKYHGLDREDLKFGFLGGELKATETPEGRGIIEGDVVSVWQGDAVEGGGGIFEMEKKKLPLHMKKMHRDLRSKDMLITAAKTDELQELGEVLVKATQAIWRARCLTFASCVDFQCYGLRPAPNQTITVNSERKDEPDGMDICTFTGTYDDPDPPPDPEDFCDPYQYTKVMKLYGCNEHTKAAIEMVNEYVSTGTVRRLEHVFQSRRVEQALQSRAPDRILDNDGGEDGGAVDGGRGQIKPILEPNGGDSDDSMEPKQIVEFFGTGSQTKRQRRAQTVGTKRKDDNKDNIFAQGMEGVPEVEGEGAHPQDRPPVDSFPPEPESSNIPTGVFLELLRWSNLLGFPDLRIVVESYCSKILDCENVISFLCAVEKELQILPTGFITDEPSFAGDKVFTLKTDCMNFITKNLKVVTKSKVFEEQLKMRPYLLLPILEQAAAAMPEHSKNGTTKKRKFSATRLNPLQGIMR